MVEIIVNPTSSRRTAGAAGGGAGVQPGVAGQTFVTGPATGMQYPTTVPLATTNTAMPQAATAQMQNVPGAVTSAPGYGGAGMGSTPAVASSMGGGIQAGVPGTNQMFPVEQAGVGVTPMGIGEEGGVTTVVGGGAGVGTAGYQAGMGSVVGPGVGSGPANGGYGVNGGGGMTGGGLANTAQGGYGNGYRAPLNQRIAGDLEQAAGMAGHSDGLIAEGRARQAGIPAAAVPPGASANVAGGGGGRFVPRVGPTF